MAVQESSMGRVKLSGISLVILKLAGVDNFVVRRSCCIVGTTKFPGLGRGTVFFAFGWPIPDWEKLNFVLRDIIFLT